MNLTLPPGYQAFSIEQIGDVFRIVRKQLQTVAKRVRKAGGGWTNVQLYNIPCAFDTENCSFFHSNGKGEQEKVAVTYVWTFCICKCCILGRTWKEYKYLVSRLSALLNTAPDKQHLVVYVHNLGYDFQFMRKWFEWDKVFSLRERTPIYAIDSHGIEYRCSYILSGNSLQKVGNDLDIDGIRKLVGDLDYTKIRHTGTQLTDKEKMYCLFDVIVICEYIRRKIQEDGNIAKIPYTKTGYVRRFVRAACFNGEEEKYKRLRYTELMGELKIQSPNEYRQLKRAFQGGFTHANSHKVGKTLEKVASFDFTSSYPTVMVCEKFPMSSAKVVRTVFNDTNIQDFYNYLNKYCCLFDVEFKGLRPKVYYESYISESRCFKLACPIVNNGRVFSADIVRTTMTEQDFMIVTSMYEWDSFTVVNLRVYVKAYLPKDIVQAILYLYNQKTQLKGVKGREVDYLRSKEMINSVYGMTVTDIVRDEILYNGEWSTETPELNTKLLEYNEDRSRFLFYPWGVWVTAYARRNLFTGIIEAGEDYVYADTDSVKMQNSAAHTAYIQKYNKKVLERLENALNHHQIPIEHLYPETIKGDKKPLGVWDYEGTYARFKTLGAKRYLVEGEDGKCRMTVAGLNKRVAMDYLEDKYGASVFDAFSTRLEIPPGKAGKLTHTYIDDTRKGVIVDYLGVKGEYEERSCIHLEPAGYNLSLSAQYIKFLSNIQDIEGSE